jgi:hypothetical protein
LAAAKRGVCLLLRDSSDASFHPPKMVYGVQYSSTKFAAQILWRNIEPQKNSSADGNEQLRGKFSESSLDKIIVLDKVYIIGNKIY